MPLKDNLEVENINIEEYSYPGRKQDFVFMGMSLMIMREEKHRKHTMCCESKFISNGIFLNIFHKTWIIGLEGATKAELVFTWRLYLHLWHPRQKSFHFLARWNGIKSWLLQTSILAINRNPCLCLKSGISREQWRVSFFHVLVWAKVLAVQPSFLSTHAVFLSGLFLCSL